MKCLYCSLIPQISLLMVHLGIVTLLSYEKKISGEASHVLWNVYVRNGKSVLVDRCDRAICESAFSAMFGLAVDHYCLALFSFH